ncbi:MAG: hypothetical protein WC802_00910 [Patescibacteria group bacterium]|jgi:hypothetical protein
MMDYRKFLGVAVVAVALTGAGCAGQAPSPSSNVAPTANVPAEVPAPVAEAPKGPVKFSEVKSDLFGIIGKYSALTFSNPAGTCVTKLPYSTLTYSPPAPGNNFMMMDKGAVIDDRSSSNTGSMLFKGKTVDGKNVDCKMMVPYGADTATLTCADAAEKEVCAGTYTISALPL